MRVRGVHNVDDLRSLEPAWRELYDQDAGADVFDGIDFYSNWWEHFGRPENPVTLVTHRAGHTVGVASREARMHVLAVEDDGRTVGVVPLVHVRGEWNRLPVRILAPAISGHSPRGGVLAARLTDGAFQALADHLAASHDWDMVILDGIRLDSGFVQGLSAAAAERGIKLVEQGSWSHLFLEITGTWEGYLASQGRNFRRGIQQGGAIEKLGATTVERYGGADIREGMRLFVEIDRSSWKASDGESLAFHPKVAAYYEGLAARLGERDNSEVWTLKIDGEAVAGFLCLRKDDVLYTLKASFNNRLARANLSPGNYLLARIVASCWERGFRRVDFVSGAAHVGRWTSDRKQFANVALYNRRLYPALVRFTESVRGRASLTKSALAGATRRRTHREAKPQVDPAA